MSSNPRVSGFSLDLDVIVSLLSLLSASSRYVLYLESTIAFLNSDYSFTKLSPHLRIRETLTIAPGTAIEIPGVNEAANRNMTLIPRGDGKRPQKVRRASWGLYGS